MAEQPQHAGARVDDVADQPQDWVAAVRRSPPQVLLADAVERAGDEPIVQCEDHGQRRPNRAGGHSRHRMSSLGPTIVRSPRAVKQFTPWKRRGAAPWDIVRHVMSTMAPPRPQPPLAPSNTPDATTEAVAK